VFNWTGNASIPTARGERHAKRKPALAGRHARDQGRHVPVRVRHAGIGQILKAAGTDFAVLDTSPLDMEHTGFSFETVRQVVRYCQAALLPLVVTLPAKKPKKPRCG